MDFFLRTRTLVAVIILLLCLNAGMLVLVLVERPAPARPRQEQRQASEEQPRIERLLREELGFDQGQIDRYLASKKQQQERMRSLNVQMREWKNKMFDGVLSDDPQPRLSDSLLRKTQEVQNQIEAATFQHLLNLRNICSPEQRLKLKDILHELITRNPRQEAARQEHDEDRPPAARKKPPRERDDQKVDRRDRPPRDDQERRPPRDDKDRRPPRDGARGDRPPNDRPPRDDGQRDRPPRDQGPR
jgi:hypothetical protein